jgi:hypothetical protein
MKLELNEPGKVSARCFVPAWLLVVVCACSPRVASNGGEAKHVPPVASANRAVAFENTVAASPGTLDFTLINFTGLGLHAIYVSPHDSAGWEENVLGQDELFDSGIVEIKFAPEERAVRWDLRAEDKDGNYAEWKNLDLREISKITLRRSETGAIAEVE